ncbi:MAG: Uma2 family endonuclease [Thermoanaerobaculia bacterium]
MSRSAAAAITPLPFELVTDDGEPMDDSRHPTQIDIFGNLVYVAMEERGRTDYYTGGNNFVYYSVEQAWDVAHGRPYFRGPDIFFVDKVADPQSAFERGAWVSWEQGGRLPDLIIELLSPSTEHIDRTDKMDLYARVFRTAEYYLYDFDTLKLEGFRRAGDLYQPAEPTADGRYWSDVLGLEIGICYSTYLRRPAPWLRLFQPDGRMIPTTEERAQAASRRAETERQRAEAAEAELARLRARLGE